MAFKKVAVIGAGTMGAGIAGQVANAGVEVLLLDLPSEGDDRNARAQAGIDRITKGGAPGVMSDAAAALITAGNIEDDFEKLAQCDWIAEAILERLDLKKDLYKKLEAVCKRGAIISSNTSTIPIRLLVEDMDKDFRARFAITHFFNPVRFMPLLELVAGEDTSDSVMETLHHFCDHDLGKGVIVCRDTPGFLGNRVGCYAIQTALHSAAQKGLSPQEADAIFGRPMGIPKTGVFGLYDLIGIDLMADVASSLNAILPEGDAFLDVGNKLPRMEQMIANDQRGRKSGAGFYRIKDGEKQVIDLASGDYAPVQNLSIPIADRAEKEGIIHALDDRSKYGDFAWDVMSKVLVYSASLIPEVGDDPSGVDDAMKMGYNWIKGPFEIIDAIGSDYLIERLESEQRPVPEYLRLAAGRTFYRDLDGVLSVLTASGDYAPLERADGAMRFNDVKKTLSAKAENEDASWYAHDGVAVVEFHSKANALDAGSMAILDKAIDAVSAQNLDGLVVHNDAQHFSCGVNLRAVRAFFEASDWDGLDRFLDDFQKTVRKMARADFPVVVAPVGLSLGGGFEVVLHGKQVIGHANSTMGLVESGVGLIPSGGGVKETLYRWLDAKDGDINAASWEAFYALGYGKTASSPIHARDMAMLRSNDTYLNNRDRIFSAAVAAVKSGEGQKPFDRPDIAVAGKPLFYQMVAWAEDKHHQGKLYKHDVMVSTELARILTGGDVAPGTMMSEQDFFDAERASFARLVKTKATQERIVSLLDEGKAVRN